MASRSITVATALLSLMLGILSPAPVDSSEGCCTSFTRKRVPFPRIMGYKEQTTNEHCNLDAIIFITINDNEVCATKEDKWVRITLKLLSSKLMNMSGSESGAAVKKPSSTEHQKTLERGSFINTTQAYLNNTESLT
ncbi:C-C motif chemokine 7-like [Cololabis saira]|uniref:C-C motif chemokine 7-like n=1 Tax=Cololabis saira TaxID=129043 RepID=UPI002AD2E090|nr:C-C motif chemokine 7-like [Cololabis saira]